MTLSDLANIGEALGGVAVLVSLVYLIFEVRRNTNTARSESAWNSAVALGELCEGISHNPQLSELVIRAVDEDSRPEDLTPEEFSQYFLFCRSLFFKYEAQWYLWREGTLSDEMWQNRRRWGKAFISHPVPARVWEIEKKQHQYTAGFMESIDSADSSVNISIHAQTPPFPPVAPAA